MKIENFRNIRSFQLGDVPDLVVLVGENGCGKSSVLDAIARFKSSIGRYSRRQKVDPSEVNVQAEEATIKATLKLTEEEERICEEVLEVEMPRTFSGAVSIQKRDGNVIWENTTSAITRGELRQVLQFFDRQQYPEFGVFDYYHPYRRLPDKEVQNYNTSFMDQNNWKGTRIVNLEKKFKQTKEFIAGLRFRDLQEIDRRSRQNNGALEEELPDSLERLRKIFDHLFAPMKFKEVRVDESPFQYVVETPNGEVDIDDLSSGEKEVFSVVAEFLKLDIKNSIILYDEPELHLHGELARRFLKELQEISPSTQFWVATHSPEIVQDAGRNNVFAIQKYPPSDNGQQIRPITDSEEMFQALSSILGNIGIVSLGKNIVFLEGESDEIDKYILEKFFEDKLENLQFISCGSVNKVMALHEKVMTLLKEGTQGLSTFYLIRDKDFMDEQKASELRNNDKLFIWNKYHIENYLLDESVLFESAEILLGNENPFRNKTKVLEALEEIAEEEADFVTSKWLAYKLNKDISGYDFNVGPQNDIKEKLVNKCNEVSENVKNDLSEESVTDLYEGVRDEVEAALEDGSWKEKFIGRRILSQFARKLGVGYEQLRNVIIDSFNNPPQEMQQVIGEILSNS